MNYRLIYTGLAFALVAVVALGIAFGGTGGEEVPLPSAIESVFPQPGDQVPRQVRIEVDMAPGYQIELFVDGFRIPDDELTTIEGIGLFSWQPGPGMLLDEWSLGEHSVRISWNTVSGVADTGEFSWTFNNF